MLNKKKQSLYENSFKMNLTAQDNKLRLIADEGSIDREIHQLKSFLEMKR